MWGNAGLGVSLGIATRPSLPLARRVAPGAVVSAGSCRRLHYVPAVVVATPTLPGRHVVVRVTAASCRRSRCRRPFVAVASSSVSPVVAALAAASPCHRVVVVRAEADRRAFERRRRAPARRRPRRAPPGRHVVGRRRRRALPSPSSSPPSSSSTLSATGRAAVVWSSVWSPSSSPSSPLSPVIIVWSSPSAPVAAVVVVDPRLYPHPSSCSATLPPASLTWDWDVTRRRRRVLCSPPPVGSVSMLARARGQNTTGPRDQT